MKVGGRGGSHVSSSSKIFHLLNAGEKLVLASQSFLFPGRLPGSTLVWDSRAFDTSRTSCSSLFSQLSLRGQYPEHSLWLQIAVSLPSVQSLSLVGDWELGKCAA